MFPTFKSPRVWEEFVEFHRQLIYLRREVYSAPLTLPHTLAVISQCTNPQPPLGTTETSSPPVIPLRHQPKMRTRAFPELLSPSEMTVVLVKELQTGLDGWAQVYEGQLTIGTQSCNVVVKLYQECMFRDPIAGNFYGSEGIFTGDWPSGTEVAQREAWAYKHMQGLQGSTVPYSYGFYTFRLRSDTVVGFIMEKISGLTVQEYFVQNVERKAVLADAFAWAVHQLHCAGVTHSDCRHSNMRILTDNGPHSLYVVLFDYSNAAPKYNQDGKFTWHRDACMKYVIFGGPNNAFKAWQKMILAQKPLPAWLEMYHDDVDNVLRFV